jgi:transposase
MARPKKADLEQMGETYFKSLEPERLIEVAKNLHALAIEQLEKLEQTSKNSSRPPSSDSPYKSADPPIAPIAPIAPIVEPKKQVTKEPSGDTAPEVEVETPTEKGFGKRKAGKQPGSKGHGRTKPLKVEKIIPHFSLTCMACNRSIEVWRWYTLKRGLSM